MNLPIGLHLDIPAGVYHRIDAANASALKVIHASTPAHLKHQRETVDKPSLAMVMGTLIHARILEPTKPLPAVAIVPETYVVPADYKGGKNDPKPGEVEPWNPRRKYCRDWKQAQEEAGLIVLERDQLDEIDRAAEAVQRNPAAWDLISGATTEATLRWDTLDGFACKARLDIIPRAGGLADLKTTNDASQRGFERAAWESGYHIQAAWYLDGFEAVAEERRGFAFVAYEKGPGIVSVYHATPEFIAAGRRDYQRALEVYRRCVESGEWPGYAPEGELDVPHYEKGKL